MGAHNTWLGTPHRVLKCWFVSYLELSVINLACLAKVSTLKYKGIIDIMSYEFTLVCISKIDEKEKSGIEGLNKTCEIILYIYWVKGLFHDVFLYKFLHFLTTIQCTKLETLLRDQK